MKHFSVQISRIQPFKDESGLFSSTAVPLQRHGKIASTQYKQKQNTSGIGNGFTFKQHSFSKQDNFCRYVAKNNLMWQDNLMIFPYFCDNHVRFCKAWNYPVCGGSYICFAMICSLSSDSHFCLRRIKKSKLENRTYCTGRTETIILINWVITIFNSFSFRHRRRKIILLEALYLIYLRKNNEKTIFKLYLDKKKHQELNVFSQALKILKLKLGLGLI